MNQDQNNLNQNNFNTQGYNNFTNNQMLMNNKPPKKFNIGLIAGAVIGIAAIGVGSFMLLNNKDNKTNNSSSVSNNGELEQKVSINGKIPYNSEKNECGFDFIEYKDNTRDLCKKNWVSFTPANSPSSTHYVDYSNFSFYLDKEETKILSYSWDGKNKNAGYNFIGTILDEETNNYVYVFTDLVNDGKYYVFLPQIKKFDIFDFTNENETKLNDSQKIYTGTFEQQFAYQKSYSINKTIKTLDSTDVAIAYFGKGTKTDIINYIDLFSSYISLDNGAPFVFDYMITNNPLGYNSDNKDTAYYITSYKYINSISYLASSGSMVNANTGVNYNLLINGVKYDYSSYYVLSTNSKEYDCYRTETYLEGAQYSLWSAFIKDENVFAITLSVPKSSNYGFVVNDPDYSLGISYYIDNFTGIITTKSGKKVGQTELYKRN